MNGLERIEFLGIMGELNEPNEKRVMIHSIQIQSITNPISWY